MDVSPKTLREVEFREKMRGYHPEDVDQFLERVAAGIEVLQDRLRQAVERAQRAEAQASEAGGTDDTLRRTLVLAQRTADLAVQEAREQAARILAGSEQQAQAVIAEAEERARRAHEDALVDARTELARLESARQQLQLDVETLTRWVEEHKVHLSSALQDALARIEHTELLSPPPVTHGPELPSIRTGVGVAPSGRAAPGLAVPSTGGDADPEAAAPAPTPAEPEVEGPATMAWRPDEREPGDPMGEGDPYFAELRRAVNAQEPLGPRDDDIDLRAG
ncbi:MAG TPA: DivIVA domain-containing protein, partial [Acidimicrobiales bacterium]|nr:DivIVA domain-containing protein [Acidimicrobiales bacterium]